jgi:uncharacterized protein (DUF488 family)
LKVFTIGFTGTSAESFFDRLKNAGAKRVVDVRLNNVSQLSGFSKKNDLRFFLKAICGIDYDHRLDLAPTQELLDAYKKEGGRWENYETAFVDLITKRRIEESISRDVLDGACLLCSESKPHRCHRRLIAEYFKTKWRDVDIVHL